MYNEFVKKVILEARITAKMSKIDLAKHLNMSMPKYYRFENEGIISLDDYINAAELFGLCIQIIPKMYVRS